ncbi:MAG: Alcohol dehydrogenase GroES domain protein [Microbacteriaceae bacterium]|jgi:NADPH2:quinone reductase|nr:Alcohol dehydrogenase GroES domain protein [Microbacteriaceae bacterium]
MAQRWLASEFGGPEVLTLEDFEVAAPGPGEVTVEVRAVGINPTDFKRFAGYYGSDPSMLPVYPGTELAGVISAIGAGTTIASGGGAVGDEVLAFRVKGAYATAVTLPAADVFAKPTTLDFPQAANLLLVGATASDALNVTGVGAGDTLLVHGASGAVGVSAIQQARLLGARVIGTASEQNFAVLEHFGAEPVAYGDGLEQRVRDLAPGGVDAALDTVGTDEAVQVSLAVVSNRDRIVTIAAAPKAKEFGFMAIGGGSPASAIYRDSVRGRLITLAAEGKLVVPVARTFPFAEAVAALQLLKSGHPGGKLALIP